MRGLNVVEAATTRRRFVLAGGALLLAGAGCGGSGGGSAAAPGRATRTVATPRGDVEVPADPRRIVVTSGGLAGTLFALGARVAATDTRVLGGETDDAGFPVLWSRYVREQRPVALPGADSIDVEAVAKARPDLIIGGGQGFTGVLAERAYPQLSRVAPTVLVSRELTRWEQELDVLARALGREERGRELLAESRRDVARTRTAITTPPQPFTVVYANNQDPFVLYESAILPRLLAATGLRPDGARAKAGDPPPYQPGGDAFPLSLERLSDVADAPTLVVLGLAGVTSSELRKRPIWRELPAFVDGRVIDLPASSYRPDYLGVLDTLRRLRDELS